MIDISKIKQKLKKTLINLLPRRHKNRLKENYITANVSLEWWEKHLNNLVLEQYQEYLKGKVADFGCNHGACTILAARNPKIEEITGFDFNEKAIKTARNLLESSNEGQAKVHFRVAGLQDIDYADNYFDSAFMFHTLEHIYQEDHQAIFSNLKRILKSGAYFIVTTPYEKAYDDGLQHVAFFNEQSLADLIEKYGFQVLECYRDQRTDQHTGQRYDCLTLLSENLK